MIQNVRTDMGGSTTTSTTRERCSERSSFAGANKLTVIVLLINGETVKNIRDIHKVLVRSVAIVLLHKLIQCRGAIETDVAAHDNKTS